MSKFIDLAMVLSEKNMSDLDQQIQSIKSEKEMAQSVFDQQLAALNAVKAQQKIENQAVKAEQKQEKLNKDLIKAMVDSGQMGPMAVGGQMVDGFAGQPEVDAEAQGLPIIEGLA